MRRACEHSVAHDAHRRRAVVGRRRQTQGLLQPSPRDRKRRVVESNIRIPGSNSIIFSSSLRWCQPNVLNMELVNPPPFPAASTAARLHHSSRFSVVHLLVRQRGQLANQLLPSGLFETNVPNGKLLIWIFLQRYWFDFILIENTRSTLVLTHPAQTIWIGRVLHQPPSFR